MGFGARFTRELLPRPTMIFYFGRPSKKYGCRNRVSSKRRASAIAPTIEAAARMVWQVRAQ
jgi:hypothetical protein